MQPVLYDAGLSSNPNPVARVSNGKDGCVHMCPIKNNFEKKTLNKPCFAGSQSPCCNLRPGHRVSLQYVCFFYWKYSCCLCDWIGLRYICRAQKTHLKFTTNALIPKWSMSNCPLACWTLSNIQKKFDDIGNAPSVWSSSPQHHIIDHHHHQPTPSNDLCVRVSKGASRHTTHTTQYTAQHSAQ